MLCRPHFGVVADPCDLRFNLLERYAPIFPAERGASGDCKPKAAVGVEARNGSHSGISRQQAGAVKRLRALSAKREGSEGCAPRMPRIQRRNFCASCYFQSPRVAHSIVFMPSCMVFICSAISLLRSSASWRPSFFRACHAFFLSADPSCSYPSCPWNRGSPCPGCSATHGHGRRGVAGNQGAGSKQCGGDGKESKVRHEKLLRVRNKACVERFARNNLDSHAIPAHPLSQLQCSDSDKAGFDINQ